MPPEIITEKRRAYDEWARIISQMRPRKVRTICQWAEETIYIPDGPYEGVRWNRYRQPWAGIYFDLLALGLWSTNISGGPKQSGKTLNCYVLPTIYHLVEIEETAVCGVPDLEMATDKWNEDFLPVFEHSHYKDLLPRRGPGSRGGSIKNRITLGNGVTLRFFAATGSSKRRAGFTSRVASITEADSLDDAALKTDESTPIQEIYGRTDAYGDRAVKYAEGIFTFKGRYLWNTYTTNSTETRLASPCVHCGEYVTPGRSDLVGWQDAKDEIDCIEHTRWQCPECKEAISEDERATMCRAAVAVHKGQEIDRDGNVTGPLPRTRTLGFRWSAFDNLFVSAGVVGAKEWSKDLADKPDLVEIELCQSVHALPAPDDSVAVSQLRFKSIAERQLPLRQGELPDDAEYITVGVDVGLWWLHWSAWAWRAHGTAHIFDYGMVALATKSIGEEQAILNGIVSLGQQFANGWEAKDGPRFADAVWVDRRYKGEQVIKACSQNGPEWFPALGFGTSAETAGRYAGPKSKTKHIRNIGDNYHLEKRRSGGKTIQIAYTNSDHWKSFVHTRFRIAVGEHGAATLFQDRPVNHHHFARHIIAEVEEREYKEGKGWTSKWIVKSRDNHFLDTSHLACAAGHFVGARVAEIEDSEDPQPSQSPIGPTRNRSVAAAAGGWFANQVRK